MYDYISGKIDTLTPTSTTVDVMGVGYFINISLQTHKELEGVEQAKLYVHLYMLQGEAPVLYGFASVLERELFRLLISVSGIGANTARVMLSSYSPSELINMIATGNVAAIQKTKGIGTKTAERVVLELKGKVVNLLSLEQISAIELSDDSSLSGNMPQNENLSEAISALLVLGFNKAATEKVAKKIYQKDPGISPENLIREALTQL